MVCHPPPQHPGYRKGYLAVDDSAMVTKLGLPTVDGVVVVVVAVAAVVGSSPG